MKKNILIMSVVILMTLVQTSCDTGWPGFFSNAFVHLPDLLAMEGEYENINNFTISGNVYNNKEEAIPNVHQLVNIEVYLIKDITHNEELIRLYEMKNYTTYTDSDGYFEIDIDGGIIVSIVIDSYAYKYFNNIENTNIELKEKQFYSRAFSHKEIANLENLVIYMDQEEGIIVETHVDESNVYIYANMPAKYVSGKTKISLISCSDGEYIISEDETERISYSSTLPFEFLPEGYYLLQADIYTLNGKIVKLDKIFYLNKQLETGN